MIRSAALAIADQAGPAQAGPGLPDRARQLHTESRQRFYSTVVVIDIERVELPKGFQADAAVNCLRYGTDLIVFVSMERFDHLFPVVVGPCGLRRLVLSRPPDPPAALPPGELSDCRGVRHPSRTNIGLTVIETPPPTSIVTAFDRNFGCCSDQPYPGREFGPTPTCT